MENLKVTFENLFDDKYADSLKTRFLDKEDKVSLRELKKFMKNSQEYLGEFEFEVPNLVKIPKDNGKFRDIFVYPKQSSFVLKLINEVVMSKWSSEVSPRVFSYVRGSQIGKAIKEVKRDLNKDLKFAKLDLSNFFIEISQHKIDELICLMFEEGVLRDSLLELYNRNEYIEKGELKKGKLGIMPGNALSCIFSNLVLKDIDDLMEKTTKSYTRYGDDIVIAQSTSDELNSSIQTLKKSLEPYQLRLNEDKTEFFDKEVKYLGMNVNKDCIDLSKGKEKGIKGYIKRTSKALRKKVELGVLTKEQALQKMVQGWNWFMYKSIIKNPTYGGMGDFVLSNITTIETIQKIDFYFLNQCRYIVTGKYNGANCKILQQGNLEELGWQSMCVLYKVRKMNKEIYRHLVYTSLI